MPNAADKPSPPPPDYEPLLNLTDAAKAVGISRKTLYQHIDKGLVSVTRKQGKRYLHIAELERHYGSVTIKTLPRNNPTQLQSNQQGGQGADQIAALTAAVQALQEETRQLRAEVQEARKASENAAQSVTDGIKLIEDKTAKGVSTASRSWWRKLWD